MLQKIYISNKMLFFKTFCSSILKKCIVSIKYEADFNIDNNQKSFLSSKSAYYDDFWRITEDWSNDAENTAAHHRNKWHFIIYENKKLF